MALEQLDNVIPTASHQNLPVVCLGGSTGSLGALQRFFEATPRNTGLAYVVVVHLSPPDPSSLPLLVATWTSMPVRVVVDGDQLEADHVYVVPLKEQATALDDSLKANDADGDRTGRVPVDLFFRSLADIHGARAVAIVLSGTDGDGMIGIKRVKERGGLTIAQEPRESEHPAMPKSAIATGMIDWVLPVAEMPARVLEYVRREQSDSDPPEERLQPPDSARSTDAQELALRQVLDLLQARTGRDFSYYKRATVVRRVARRVQVNRLAHVNAYLDFLRTHAAEAPALLQDLLISVTNFFRDRQTFQALESMMPDLFRGKGHEDTLRVWVPACATGEEAYSIAMLLATYARTLDAPPVLQVFGCDLDEAAIQVARSGLYPATIVADVDELRLRQFFVKEPRGYRVRRELREMVVFATHDLLKDSPFSRMDLVSCRNLLIYLNEDAQRRVFDIFHFALRPGGLLLLGLSETVDEKSALFQPIDMRHRIYRQVSTENSNGRGQPGARSIAVAVTEHDSTRGQTIPAASFVNHPLRGRYAGLGSTSLSPSDLHFRLLERFAPPSLVIDSEHEILHVSKGATQFLDVPTGEPTLNVVRMIHPMLRADLREALARAAETSLPLEVADIPLERNGQYLAATLRVLPARELAPGCMLILFETREIANSPPEVSQEISANQPIVARLEREIELHRARLRENAEQYEASTEELKAGNEELNATNEELRSAIEELESTRQQLASNTEELAAANSELQNRLGELSQANSDLHNLMASTDIAIVFLDRKLRITRYTPRAVHLFNIIGTDLGRPLADLQHRLDYPSLIEDAQQVLETLAPVERELRARSEWYLARLRPYRTVDDHIGGLVLTFVDITSHKQVQEEFRRSEERLHLVVENARDYAIFSLDLDRRIISWSSGAQQILGYSREEALGKVADMIFTADDRAAGAPEMEAQRALSDGRALDQRWHARKDGSTFWGNGALMAMRDADGQAIGFVKIFRDETNELHAKQALEKSREEILLAFRETERARSEAVEAGRAKDHFLAVLSHELRTPLTPVLMATRTLSRRKDLPPEANEALAMIERNVQLEAQFIDDLLDVTRISRGKLELAVERVDLHEALRRAVEVTRQEIESKAQTIELALEAKESRVMGDRRRLQQVFWNLLKNASKFTPRHGSIRVLSRTEQRSIVVEVHDSGVGFEPDDSARIFTAFEQANESISREFGGLGLGLAIVKASIQAHGGTVVARSAGRGHGATFIVELALADEGVTS